MGLNIVLFHSEYQITLLDFTYDRDSEEWSEPAYSQANLERKQSDKEYLKLDSKQQDQSQFIDCFGLCDRQIVFFTKVAYFIYNTQFQLLGQGVFEYSLHSCFES